MHPRESGYSCQRIGLNAFSSDIAPAAAAVLDLSVLMKCNHSLRAAAASVPAGPVIWH